MAEELGNQPVVVIDTGSSFTQAGFSNEDSPKVVFPSVIGRPRHQDVAVAHYDMSSYVGEIVFKRMAHNRNPIPSFPIQNGRVVHWNEVESIWRHALYVELRCQPDDDLPILLLAKPDSSKESMETMTKKPYGPDTGQRFVGEQAANKRGILTLKYPIECGIVTNWDDWETLCYHVFLEELRVRYDERAVLLTEAPNNPMCNREKFTQIMFETFEVPALYLAADAAMSLLQSGRTTGIVLEAGEGNSQTIPVYEGSCLRYCIQHLPLSGRDITNYMRKLLRERGHNFESTVYTDTVRDMKEKLCYIALDFQEELQTGKERRSIEKSYELPDGEILTIEDEHFRCPEPLFQPNLVGLEMPGIHEILHSSIRKCNSDLRNDMYSNIVLAGGNSSSPGFAERITKEMTTLAPQTANVNVTSNVSVAKNQLAWLGGSILASSSNFLDMCMNKEDYDEYGPSLIRKMCI